MGKLRPTWGNACPDQNPENYGSRRYEAPKFRPLRRNPRNRPAVSFLTAVVRTARRNSGCIAIRVSIGPKSWRNA